MCPQFLPGQPSGLGREHTRGKDEEGVTVLYPNPHRWINRQPRDKHTQKLTGVYADCLGMHAY